jgi:catalase
VSNLAGDLRQVKNETTRAIMLSHFYKADAGYGTALTAALGDKLATVTQRAAALEE